ncbi:uncharacterized protein K441DRAFT_700596 [Cenococcum geophilum 1.58]|uniref:Uncharacterized protein n=1 Tax=Cenococcum geophilum 1.58 TaxID=794803 RepID=A0ACC8EQ40_9PEZI|nr:hypothetical protein K441DRAFT_700596 [Cenococcum geophilum 1.58]
MDSDGVDAWEATRGSIESGVADCKGRASEKSAGYAAKLYRKKFGIIGNIYNSHETTGIAQAKALKPSPEEEIAVQSLAMTRSCTIPHESLQTMERTEIVDGRIVAPEFFMGGPGSQDILKGHFKCSREWLVAKLNMVLNDCCRVCRESKEEDDLEEAELVQQVTLRLTKGLPKPFAENDKTHEPTVLFHDDLSARNILADKNRVVAAACQLLKFLDDTKQMQMPAQEGFRCDKNREIGEEFWEYMQDYEKIQLRQVFLEEMERVEPAWVKEYRRSTVKADFESAVDIADSGWYKKAINGWLDQLDAGGGVVSLRWTRFNA